MIYNLHTFKKHFFNKVNDVAQMLHSNNKIIILVIPPAIKTMNDMKKQLDDTNVAFSNQDFYYLRDIVDGFSLVCNF